MNKNRFLGRNPRISLPGLCRVLVHLKCVKKAHSALCDPFNNTEIDKKTSKRGRFFVGNRLLDGDELYGSCDNPLIRAADFFSMCATLAFMM